MPFAVRKERYEALGHDFVQDNHSRSRRGVLRGLHFQERSPQGKLVRVSRGHAFDVAVDIDPDSPTFRKYVAVELDDASHTQFFIPPGYAHGFCVLSDIADFEYKCTTYYDADDGRGVLWNDPSIGIRWPVDTPIVSAVDAHNSTPRRLSEAMKVLVTGSQGQVGSEMAKLGDADFRVSAFDRLGLDITNRDQIERRLDETDPDLVVNCAAYTAVDRAEDEPALAHLVNADAVGRLGDACAGRGIGTIHLSTDYVFDGCEDGPYLENDAPNPLGVYGASKLVGENHLRDATERHIILRVSWVFGRLGRSFVDTMLRLGHERDELTVVDDQIGAPSPATVIAQAIQRIAETLSSRDDAWGTYHFSTTPAVSWYAFARCIVAARFESTSCQPAQTSAPSAPPSGRRKSPDHSTRGLTRARLRQRSGMGHSRGRGACGSTFSRLHDPSRARDRVTEQYPSNPRHS